MPGRATLAAPVRSEMALTIPLPYRRLSNFYFWYYGLLGLLHPFWAVFLSHRNFSSSEIGLLIAALMGTRVISPNLWGWIADHSGRRMGTIRTGAALGLLAFLGIFAADGFWSMLLVVTGYSFFWNAVMPQFEALTLDYLGDHPEYYSRIRLWGSVGFIVAVIGGGYWFQERIGDFRYGGALVLMMIWLATLFVKAPPAHPHPEGSGAFRRVVFQTPVLAFLLMSFLLQLAHGIYYSFFSLHLEGAGYPRSQVGLFWALSVVAEIVLFLGMPRMLGQLSLWSIMILSLALTTLRWLLIAFFVESLWIIALAQCLHAFSFGAAHAVSIEYIRRFFAGSLRGRGQALYTSASFGAGGALGAGLGGFLWDYSPAVTFLVAAAASLLATGIAWRWLNSRRQSDRAMRELLSR